MQLAAHVEPKRFRKHRRKPKVKRNQGYAPARLFSATWQPLVCYATGGLAKDVERAGPKSLPTKSLNHFRPFVNVINLRDGAQAATATWVWNTCGSNYAREAALAPQREHTGVLTGRSGEGMEAIMSSRGRPRVMGVPGRPAASAG
jgi:hypothetical protein